MKRRVLLVCSLRPGFLSIGMTLVLAGCTPPIPVDTTTEEPAPVVSDSDGDGFSDFDEVTGSPATDPFDASDNPNSVRDTDGDGCSDFEEINAALCDGDPNTPTTPPPPPPSGPVTLDGSVLVSASLLVDGDTNDVTNPVVFNNAVDAATAQPAPNPATIGGFLGIGAFGADTQDVYRVQMAAGQTATLLLADPIVNDFDLFLYDENGTLLASSEGVGKAEQVTASSNGTFLLEVFGFSVDLGIDTGGLYSLLVGEEFSTTITAAIARERLSCLDPFVNGDVLVKFKPGVAAAARARVGKSIGLAALNDNDNAGQWRRLRVNAVKAFARFDAQASIAATGRPRCATLAAVKQLRRNADVLAAQPNYIHTAYRTPNDQYFNLQWHYPLIGLPQAWDISLGDGVVVAIIDTGVVLDHPDLQGQFVSGYDFISDPATALDGDGIDADPNDPGDSDTPGLPSSFHGTHVAGTVAARTDNATGVAGVAWNARIMPLRVLGKGGGTSFDIAQAIRFAAGLSNNSGTVPAQPADIINMSLGGPGFSQVEQDAITAARNAGVIIITAAGNANTNGDNDSPGGLDGVFNVSAVDLDRNRAVYSNFGNSVVVAAPGGDIQRDDNGDGFVDGVLSTVGSDAGAFDFAFYDGTSMAAPHVAGVVALMMAVHPGLTPQDFDLLLSGSHPGTSIAIVDDLGDPGKDTFFGYGLINAVNAVRAAQEIAGAPPVNIPVIRVIPTNLNLGSTLSGSEIIVTNAGAGTLNVTGVTTSDPWLAVTPTQGTAGSYNLTVDRGSLADGVYTGSVNFASDGGNASVSVRITVGTEILTGGNVGTMFVLLVDPNTFATVAQAETVAEDDYAFNMTNVPPGEYLLFAGTDMDNNGFIDDEGEALGSFPVLSKPDLVSATADRSGLSFGVSYLVNIQTVNSADPGGATEPPRPRLRRIGAKSVRQ